MRVAICTFTFPEFSASLAVALGKHCQPIVFVPEERLNDAIMAPMLISFPYKYSDGVLK